MSETVPDSNKTESVAATGSCLCGKVRVAADAMTLELACCHCSMCQHWGGGPFMTVECGTAVKFDGEEHIARYSSSDWGERGFCKHCGSHLFYRLKPTDDYHMAAGLFTTAESVERRFTHQLFIEEKPDYYAFANNTRNLTGEQLFAEFAGQLDGD